MDLTEFIRHVKRSPQQKHFYHFVDRKNVPSIKQYGLLSLELASASGIDIPAPGGNDWSHDADKRCGMHEYVHLCFKTGHPMVDYCKKDGRITDLVYLKVKPEAILLPGVLITDDVSNKVGVSREPPDIMLDKIDLEVLYTYMNWNDPVVYARLRAAEKCEILVPGIVPPEYIEDI